MLSPNRNFCHRATKIVVVSLKSLDHHRPNREEFKPVNSEDSLIYELMPIFMGIGPNEDLICYGSCFVAWPHMAITAKHVVEELLKQDPAIALGKPSRYTGSFRLYGTETNIVTLSGLSIPLLPLHILTLR